MERPVFVVEVARGVISWHDETRCGGDCHDPDDRQTTVARALNSGMDVGVCKIFQRDVEVDVQERSPVLQVGFDTTQHVGRQGEVRGVIQPFRPPDVQNPDVLEASQRRRG